MTAIVLHENIKPSFFLAVTGAVYLDPNYLWLTLEQKQSLKKTVDFRQCLNKSAVSKETKTIDKPADIRNALQFLPLTRYVKDGAFALSNTDGSREDLHVCHGLASVVLHELAHAVDKFPANLLTQADKALTPMAVSQSLDTQHLGVAGNVLHSDYPLNNAILTGLAGVMFQGQTLTDDISALTALGVGQQIDTDQANDLYNYSKTSEDVAMLFEEYMMKRLFDIDREIAFVTPVSEAITRCKDLRFDYQKVNRIASVIPRAESVVAKILPDYYQTVVANDALTVKSTDFSWCNVPQPHSPVVTDQVLRDNELDCVNLFEKRFHQKVHQKAGL